MSKYSIGDYDYQIPGSGMDSLAWEIDRLKVLCARAAEALEKGSRVRDFDCTKRLKLITELRKAASE